VRAADAAAQTVRATATRREAEKRQAQRGNDAQDREQSARRERRRAEDAARAAERDVNACEQRVASCRAELQDPALYDGTAAAARRAAELTRTLKDAEAALDGAMHRWLEATAE